MSFISNIFHLNYLATISLNYRAGGLSAVFRMPIKVYGKMRWHVSGQIILPQGAQRNTLIIGSEHEDYTASAGKAELNIRGTWNIGGMVRISPDSFIGIGKDATLTMGNGCMIGRDSQIHCTKSVMIGDDVFSGELYITDSSVHKITISGKEMPTDGAVNVGNGTYLGFRCMLLKGCNIPPRSVVASGAICTKDYTKEGESELFLTGTPATVRRNHTSALL